MNLVGAAFWVSVLTALGVVLGQNYHLVDQYSSSITYALVGAFVLFVVDRISKTARASSVRTGADQSTRPASMTWQRCGSVQAAGSTWSAWSAM